MSMVNIRYLVAVLRIYCFTCQQIQIPSANTLQHSGARSPKFECPPSCLECFPSASPTQFRCVLPRHEVHAGIFRFPAGRNCKKPEKRLSNRHQSRLLCDFTEREMKDQTHILRREPKSFETATFGSFIDNNKCSLTGLLGTHYGIIDDVVTRMFFELENTFLGQDLGVCNKPREYLGICKDGNDDCVQRHYDNLCEALRADRKTGRLDDGAMSMWAAAMGPLESLEKFRLPETPPTPLKHLAIPGWSDKVVAMSRPSEETPLPNEASEHGFWCMMQKLQKTRVIDFLDGDPLSNKYNNSLGNRGVLDQYFRNFFYPDPYHFVIADSDLQTDETLAKLVFESIGAHHVEVIARDRSRSFSLGTIQVDGLPPNPLDTLVGYKSIQDQVSFVVRLDAVFADVDKLVRKGMERWGGNAFFDSKGKLLALQYNGATISLPQEKNGEEMKNWMRFKFIFRSSLISMVTAFDHLVCTHILTSQSLAMAAFETLPMDHDLRVLLAPHVWNTLKLNFAAAANLYSPQMLVHRASPFDKEAFGDVHKPEGKGDGKIWKKAAALRYKTFAETYRNYSKFKHQEGSEGFPEMPYFEDGILLYSAVKRYLTRFANKQFSGGNGICNSTVLEEDNTVARFLRRFFYYSEVGTESFYVDSKFRDGVDKDCDKFVTFLTEMIFMVTGFHSHVGVVTDFFRDTSFASTSWAKGETEARPKHAMLMMLLASLTTGIHPRMHQSLSDIYWDHRDKHPQTKREIPVAALFKSFNEDLLEVQRIIERRNKIRLSRGRMQYLQMSPNYLLWGVSV